MLERTRKGLLRAMCMMAEFGETGAMLHLDRVSHLSCLLADELASRSPYAPLLDEEFLANIAECAGLHDIGKTALPDSIRRKPGPLTRRGDAGDAAAHDGRPGDMPLHPGETWGPTRTPSSAWRWT